MNDKHIDILKDEPQKNFRRTRHQSMQFNEVGLFAFYHAWPDLS